MSEDSREFPEDVKRAQKDNIRQAFDAFYRDNFDVLTIEQASEYMDYKRGVDIVIKLVSGRSINSQEKLVCAWHTNNPGSVYIEIEMISSNGYTKRGWIFDDCDADILAICYEKYEEGEEPKCFGFMMKEFKQVARDNIDRWHTIYRLLKTPSTHNGRKWVTHCLLVPYGEIRMLIDKARAKKQNPQQ